MRHPGQVRLRAKGHRKDCAACVTVQQCWDATVAAASGFSIARHSGIDKHAVLFHQGDAFTGVHIVASGYVKLRETNADGIERLVALCLPGELLGLEGWVKGRYAYTAIAATATKVCQLHWPHTQEHAAPAALLDALLRKSIQQLEFSRHQWMSLPAKQRVAAFLEHFTQRAPTTLELPLTRAEMGSLLGLAEETVVRALTQLRTR